MRMMVLLDAARAVPLRREVPRRACPEAQEGRAWLPVELLALCRCVGRFSEGRVPSRRRVVLGCLSCVSFALFEFQILTRILMPQRFFFLGGFVHTTVQGDEEDQ